jgi:hypothetical protein
MPQVPPGLDGMTDEVRKLQRVHFRSPQQAEQNGSERGRPVIGSRGDLPDRESDRSVSAGSPPETG